MNSAAEMQWHGSPVRFLIATALALSALSSWAITPAGAKEEHTIEFRPVLAELQTSANEVCDGCALLPVKTGALEPDRLLVGRAVIRGDGIEHVERRFQNQLVVQFEFNRRSSKKFNQLARRSFGKPSPQDQVAVVVDGVVVSRPAFQSPTFDGPVQISGNFSRQDADRLVAKIKSACDC